MSTAPSKPLPRTILFARGTIARLALWPALKLAVHESWGGPASAEKQRWLAGVIVDQFEEYIVAASSSPQGVPSSSSAHTGAEAPPPNEDYVEELLLQIMSDEFDVSLEDDSAIAVARDIVKLFRDICAGNDAVVIELEAQADRMKGKLPQYEAGIGSGSGSESGSDWEDEVGEEEEDGEDGEEERVPQLLDRPEPRRREEPEVDEDGFTLVKKNGRR